MKTQTMDADREWLLSLGIEQDLIDSPSGTQMIRVIFGDSVEDAYGTDESSEFDRGFACVA